MTIFPVLVMFMLLRTNAFVLRSSTSLSHLKRTFQSHKLHLISPKEIELDVSKKLKALPELISNPRIVLSVSGGSDSMAMLFLFNALRSRHAMQLEVVNFNHKIRPESFEEAEFVKSVCKSFDIPFRCIEAGNNQFVNCGQDDYRNWRRKNYQDIFDTYKDRNAFIATAHTSDDQTETILMKLLRGAHISHIQGMNILEGYYFRPLLGIDKNSLRDYVKSHGGEWREDSSNADTLYRRNLVRLETIPSLAKACGGVGALQSRLHNLAEQSNDLNEWVLKEANEVMQYVDCFQYPTDQYPHLMDLSRVTADKQHLLLNPLVMSHIVNTWLVKHTGEAVSYENIKRIVTMLAEATSRSNGSSSSGDVVKKRSVSCAGEYEVTLLDRQLRLRVKQKVMDKRSGINERDTSETADGSLNVGKQQQSERVVCVECSINGRRETVKVVYPSFVTVSAGDDGKLLISVTQNVGDSNQDVGDLRSVYGPNATNSLRSWMRSLCGPFTIKNLRTDDITNVDPKVIRVRFPKEGDTFQHGLRASPQSLTSYLRERQVPFEVRDRVMLVTLEGGKEKGDTVLLVLLTVGIFYT